ncbi:hypothetical protein IE077_002884 [Cardiosporidium cionae]|uniref:Dymeclin n=1 Tax=Cardiosporidium cionae TaxID=476202 RepID=A0ABQ7JFR6_9APIC|nr:hypothetical protein IE077_002884 [Cardiosporidium cionae]|eukprot:KAF8822720.1 hypothetical protein IE077_002884 [Cardiosporidium cionae]
MIENRGFAFRESTGDSFTLMDLPSHLHNISFKKAVAIIPLGVPRRDFDSKYTSVTSSLFRECCLFCFDTLESLSPLSCMNIFCIHQELLNIMLTLFDKISPKEYVSMSREHPFQDDEINKIENLKMKAAISFCKSPPYQSAHAQSVFLYYLYMQARQPFPLIPVPTILWKDSLTPSMCFVEALMEMLGEDIAECNPKDASKILQEESADPIEVLSITAKLLSYLLSAVWLSSQSSLSSQFNSLKSKHSFVAGHDSSYHEISITSWLHRCLNIFVLLSYYPSPDVREQLATATEVSSIPLKENFFTQALNEMSDPNFFSSPNSSLITQKKCLSDDIFGICDSSAKIDFRFLLNALYTSDLGEHMLPILLLTLICKNRKFRLFCSTALECENLLYKILELLHRIPSSHARLDLYSERNDGTIMQKPPLTPFATCLTLSLFLLCQEKLLCERLQEREFENIKWIDITPLRKISLGSLVIFVINRMMNWSLAYFDDVFFNKLCGAILVNVAPFTKRIHWHVADRLVALTSMITGEIKEQLLELNDYSSKSLPDGFESMAIVSTTSIPALCSLLSPNHLNKNIEILYSLVRLNPRQCYEGLLDLLNVIINNNPEGNFNGTDKNSGCQEKLCKVENDEDKTMEARVKLYLCSGNENLSCIRQILLLAPFLEYLIELISFFISNLGEDLEEASIEQVKSLLMMITASLSFDHNISVGYKRLGTSSLLNSRYAFSETFESAAYFLPLMWKCTSSR